MRSIALSHLNRRLCALEQLNIKSRLTQKFHESRGRGTSFRSKAMNYSCGNLHPFGGIFLCTINICQFRLPSFVICHIPRSFSGWSALSHENWDSVQQLRLSNSQHKYSITSRVANWTPLAISFSQSQRAPNETEFASIAENCNFTDHSVILWCCWVICANILSQWAVVSIDIASNNCSASAKQFVTLTDRPSSWSSRCRRSSLPFMSSCLNNSNTRCSRQLQHLQNFLQMNREIVPQCQCPRFCLNESSW